MIPLTEGFAPFYELARIGPFILITNAAIAFLLNIAAVFLVGAGSGLVLTLAGVFKVSSITLVINRNGCSIFLYLFLGYLVSDELGINIWCPNHTVASLWILNCVDWTCAFQDFWEQVKGYITRLTWPDVESSHSLHVVAILVVAV